MKVNLGAKRIEEEKGVRIEKDMWLHGNVLMDFNRIGRFPVAKRRDLYTLLTILCTLILPVFASWSGESTIPKNNQGS